jgi:hypothetical protein
VPTPSLATWPHPFIGDGWLLTKLADSSNTHHGEAWFFFSTRRKKLSMRIELSADSSSDNPGRSVVLVDLIASDDDSSNNSGDDSGNNSDDNFEDHEASSETIMHDLSLYLHIFSNQLF